MAEQSDQDRSEAQIRRRIEATRARMGDTIEGIGEHLDPQHLKHELRAGIREQVEDTKAAARAKVRTVTHHMGDTMNHTSRTVRDRIRENPVPAAMVGVGLGWLLAEGRKHPASRDGGDEGVRYGATSISRPRPAEPYAEPYATRGYAAPLGAEPVAEVDVLAVAVDVDQPDGAGASEGAREKAEQAGAELRDRAGDVAERVRETASELEENARGAAQRAQQRASQAMDEARQGVDRVRRGAEQTWREAEVTARRMESSLERGIRENPLAAGAAMVAAGFAIGMLVPETTEERELMGPTRERLSEQAQQKAEQVGEKVKHVAEETAKQAQSAARQAARQEGLSL